MKTGRRLLVLGTALLLAGGLQACDGSNAFTDPGGGGGGGTAGADTIPPTVQIRLPRDSTAVAVGDSVFVEVRLADNVALDSVYLEGFALRGDPNLGTQVRIERFRPKVVKLDSATQRRVVKDTIVTRYLTAALDSTPDRRVFVVVTARDRAGRESRDTSVVSIGGPRVQIVSPGTGSTFPAGIPVPVRLSASDPDDRIRSITLRVTGAFAQEVVVSIATPRASVDTTVFVTPPVQGNVRLEAFTLSGANLQASSRPVDLVITAPAADRSPPRVSFTVTTATRAEPRDTIRVDVQATDETRVDSVGATVIAIRRRGTAADTLRVLSRVLPATSGQLRFMLEEFATPAVPFNGLDTLNVSFEVTAWSKDSAGNCASAVSAGVVQSIPCRSVAGATVSDGPGALQSILLTRGATIPPPNPGDVIADMVADGNRLFLSNLSRNRVEVLPVGATTYATPVRVGSEPWGLAIGRTGDTLFVGNSGGTNISVIPLRNAALQEAEGKRILTQNERLYAVDLSITSGLAEKVTLFDYSDRPQFIGQASNGLLVYSTRPSASAPDGTVRIFDGVKRREEIFTGYVPRFSADKALVVNADSAFLVTPGGRIRVCPRRPFGAAADPGCIVDTPRLVEDSLRKLRSLPRNASGGKYDTRVDIFADVKDVGFADTTFVATSGDRNYVAVGEGVRGNARIPMFRAAGDSLVLVGDVSDLISNAAERVIGLGINRDGSLGVARGDFAYYFTERLRLQGRVQSGSPAGGVAMHPANANYPDGSDRLSFVSGIDAQGPYVDVIDTFNFFRISRLYVRDPVVGALVVAPPAATDPASVVIRLYALTGRGVLGLRLTTADLTRQ